MNNERELFSGIHSKTCASCGREEPLRESPGWPDSGRFLVVRNGKICSSCLSEAISKREALDKGRFMSESEK